MNEAMETITVRVQPERAAFVRDLLKAVAAEPCDFTPSLMVFGVVKLGTRPDGRCWLTSSGEAHDPDAKHTAREVAEAHGYLAGFLQGTAGCLIEGGVSAAMKAPSTMRMQAAMLEGGIRAVESKQAEQSQEGGAE